MVWVPESEKLFDKGVVKGDLSGQQRQSPVIPDEHVLQNLPEYHSSKTSERWPSCAFLNVVRQRHIGLPREREPDP